jgi:CRISPR-associated protein Csd1
MGFWQGLADSYDKNADALKTLYPLSTTSISNNADIIAVITINQKGDFIKADKIDKMKKDSKKKGEYIVPPVSVLIPVTEESMGRSSGIAPHPVFDQHEYLKGDGKKFEHYIAELEKFANSEFATKQIKAIYKYASKGSIAADLTNIVARDKTNIIFKVEIKGNPLSMLWEDETFFTAWHNYYRAQKEIEGNKDLDYFSGKKQLLAIFHPKKISNSSANSKLISDNDKTNFTFRGKFKDSSEAFSISYESSQKAHQFLRYLINDRGIYCGEQVILSYSIGKTEKLPAPLDDTKSLLDEFPMENEHQTSSDKKIALRAETGYDYADALKTALGSLKYGKALQSEKHEKTAVIALDAATTGRLSITFYRELDRNDYFEKLFDWHDGCKWCQKFWDKEKEKYIPYIGAPAVDRIIEAIYGKPRKRQDDSNTKIQKAARERLLRCIFDGANLPFDYLTAAVRRASNPLGITKDGKFDRNGFEQILSTTCALVRKYYQESRKEDYKLSIELERRDRDYLYGRLLGAADKLEEYALHKKDKDRIVTAAIRYMQTFAQRPFRTWTTVHGCLNPYIQTVKSSFAFQEIEAIKGKFTDGDYEKDVPLNGSYLLGYYHERAYIDKLAADAKAKSKLNDNNKTEDNNDDN